MRIFLTTFAFSLLIMGGYDRWTAVPIDLPTIDSTSPVYVSPKLASDIRRGGGGSGGRLQSSMQGLDLSGVRMPDQCFRRIDIESSDFSRADLRRTDFSGATIWYSSFIGANLTDADFTNAQLLSSDMTDANLAHANFKRADLSHTDFTKALVSNADFRDADLSNADLEEARGLTYAQVSSAIVNEFTSLPPRLIAKRPLLIEMSKNAVRELRSGFTAEE